MANSRTSRPTTPRRSLDALAMAADCVTASRVGRRVLFRRDRRDGLVDQRRNASIVTSRSASGRVFFLAVRQAVGGLGEHHHRGHDAAHLDGVVQRSRRQAGRVPGHLLHRVGAQVDETRIEPAGIDAPHVPPLHGHAVGRGRARGRLVRVGQCAAAASRARAPADRARSRTRPAPRSRSPAPPRRCRRCTPSRRRASSGAGRSRDRRAPSRRRRGTRRGASRSASIPSARPGRRTAGRGARRRRCR